MRICYKIWCLLLLFWVVTISLPVRAASVPAPKDLQATITGSGGTASVHLQWSDDPGLNYLVTKQFPDGRQMQFTIQSAIVDPKCIMRGGTFIDPLIERGKTYTYTIKAFDSLLNYSDLSTISVTINVGESLGCLGRRSISLNASGNNFVARVHFENPDGKKYQIFVDGKLRKITSGETATIWPVFGATHQIRVAEIANNQSVISSAIAQPAEACAKELADETVSVNQNYSGLVGNILRKISSLLPHS